MNKILIKHNVTIRLKRIINKIALFTRGHTKRLRHVQFRTNTVL